MKRTRLKPVSDKRRATFEARAEAMRAVTARSGGRCEAQRLIDVVDPAAARRCTTWATEGHEPLKRSRGGDPTDPAQIVHCCHNCHAWTEAEPALATDVGLLIPSWENH